MLIQVIQRIRNPLMNDNPSATQTQEQQAAVEEKESGLWKRMIESLKEQLRGLWDYISPTVMRYYEYFIVFLIQMIRRFWESAYGKFLQETWKKLCEKWMDTRFGKWLKPKAMIVFQYIVTQYNVVVVFYKKLTGPTPHPIMLAMMMKHEPIDINDDDIVMRGNKIFVSIIAFFTIFAFWAYFTQLDEVVRAEGIVIPSNDIQMVQNRLPGSVVSIEVSLGDHVKKGDILFRLEDEDVIANLDDNEITRLSSLATKARLMAQENGHDVIDFPEWLEVSAPKVVSGERVLFDKNKIAIQGRLEVIARNIKENEAGARVASIQAENLRQEVDILKPLVEDGLESKLRLLSTLNQLAQAEGTVEMQNLAAERGQEEYASILSSFRAESSAQLAEIKVQAEQAGARDAAFRAKVKYAKVVAPVSGVVSSVYVKTIGAVLQSGATLAEIVPDNQDIVTIRARLPAEKIADVYIGQIAQVGLSSYNVARFGTLEGTIRHVSQNTTQEEGMPPYYETIIVVEELRFSKSTDIVDVTTGTPTMIDIIGKKRSILNYIFTPLERAAGVVFREK